MAKNRKLGRTSDQRKAMLRNLATDVIINGKIETTVTRAKEVRSIVDELITLGNVEIYMQEEQKLQLFFSMLKMKQFQKMQFKNYLMILHLNMQMLMVDTHVF